MSYLIEIRQFKPYLNDIDVNRSKNAKCQYALYASPTVQSMLRGVLPCRQHT